MTLLSDKLKRRIVIAVTSEKYGKELIDAIEGSSTNTGSSIVNTPIYTVTDNDYYIGVNTSSGPVTIILSTPPDGKEIVIKDESGNCAVNVITLVGNVDNDPSGAIMAINNSALHLIYRSGWRIV
jgi:hypothetical protein